MLSRFRSQNGAVSVYLIIIFVPLFLFVAMFIDFARIKAAELETEQALQAGVRSVLSAYHPDLQPWGLFGLGVDTEEADTIFSRVLSENMQPEARTNYFGYLDTELKKDSSHVTPMYMLSNHTVFERQVLEEMKYRAPIEYALEITDKLQKPSITTLTKNGASFTNNAEKLDKLINKREDALDSAWSRTEDLNIRIDHAYNSNNEALNELQELANKIGDETESSLQAQLQSLSEKDKDKDDDEAEDANKSEKERIQQILGWIREYIGLLAQTKLEAEWEYTRLLAIQKDVDEYIQKAKKANGEIVTELKVVNQETSGQESLEVNDVFKSVFIRDDTYFSSFQSGVASVVALFAKFRSDLGQIYLYNEAKYATTLASNEAYLGQNQSFYQGQAVIEGKRQEENDNINGQKKERRKEIKSVLDQAKKTVMSSCVVGSEKATKQLYEELEGDSKSKQDGLFSKYLGLNQVIGAGDNGISIGLTDPDESTKISMNLLGGLADLLVNARDELYLNEYALTKYNYRTLGLEQTPNGEMKKELSLNSPSTHALFNQEVEYLIYGFSSCGSNLTSAYGEMFAIRFAIRTLEELTEPKNKLLAAGSPWLVLISAAAKGAIKAYSDMEDLTNGKAVQISSKITGSAFTFTYKDYLRLFLFIHSNDKKLMSRMQSLIELNTSVNLANIPTYVEGVGTTSTKLWFTSGLLKALQLTGKSQCVVSSNRCEIVKSAVMAY